MITSAYFPEASNTFQLAVRALFELLRSSISAMAAAADVGFMALPFEGQ